MPLAAGITLAVRQYVSVTVESAAELAKVGFGWPLAWTVQDHSALFDPVGYPTTVYFIGDRRGGAIEPPPTTIDWGAFLIDGLVVWALIVAVATMGIEVTRRSRQTKPAMSR